MVSTVQLDAGAFPHILDLVLEASALTTLLAFRGTSHTFKTKVNTVLQRNGYQIVIKGSTTGTPKVTFRDSNVVPKHSAAHLAPSARLVDVYNSAFNHDLSGLLPFLKPDFIRIFDYTRMTSRLPFSAPTVIISLDAFPTETQCSHSTPSLFSCYTSNEVVARVVINVRTRDKGMPSLSSSQVAVLRFPLNVREAVFLFSQVASHNEGGTLIDDALNNSTPLVNAIVDCMRHSFWMNITFVDTGFMVRRPNDRLPIELYHDAMDQALQAMNEHPQGPYNNQSMGNSSSAQLHFDRTATYRMSIGEEQFTIETMSIG